MRRGCGLLALAVLLVAATTGGDPYRDQQWWLGAVAASAGTGQRIAIVDSGIDLDHPDLVDRLARLDDGSVEGIDLVDGDAPEDPSGHGTMVAGLAAAQADNGEGIVGTAPGAVLLPVRVLDARGAGTAARVAAGVRWAVEHGATVVNVSLEASDTDGSGLLDAPSVQAAVREAAAAGVNVVIAAGNQARDERQDLPAIVVGAHDRRGVALPSSGAGERVLFAPGVDMVSTWCRGAERCSDGDPSYGVGSGTSFAAPVVAGLLARGRAAGLDAEAAEGALRASSVPIGGAVEGRRLATDALVLPGVDGDVVAAGATTIAPAPDAELPRDRTPQLLVAVGIVLAATVLGGSLRRRR